MCPLLAEVFLSCYISQDKLMFCMFVLYVVCFFWFCFLGFFPPEVFFSLGQPTFHYGIVEFYIVHVSLLSREVNDGDKLIKATFGPQLNTMSSFIHISPSFSLSTEKMMINLFISPYMFPCVRFSHKSWCLLSPYSFYWQKSGHFSIQNDLYIKHFACRLSFILSFKYCLQLLCQFISVLL